MRLFLGSKAVKADFGALNVRIGEVPKVEVEGSLGFPAFGTSGLLDIPLAVSGKFGFEAFSVSGEFFRPTPTLLKQIGTSAKINVSLGEVDVRVGPGFFLVNGPTFPAFGMGGFLAQPVRISSRMGFSAFNIMSSALDVPTGVRGVIGFQPFGLNGDVFVPPLQIGGPLGLPAFGTSGTIRVPVGVVGGVNAFPAFGMRGDIELNQHLDGSVGLPPFGMRGELRIDAAVIGGIDGFPAFGMRARLDAKIMSVKGRFGFRAFDMSGRVGQDRPYSGSINLPAFGMSGRIEQPVQIEGPIGFPAFGIGAEIAVLFPVDVEGMLGFPAFGLKGRIVQVKGTGGAFRIVLPRRDRRRLVELYWRQPTPIEGTFGFPPFGLDGDISQPINIQLTAIPNGTATVAYSADINASGGKAPYTFARVTGALPPGLSMDANGVISGTPTTAGTYNFTVRATDALGNTGDRAYSISIAAAPIPAFEATYIGGNSSKRGTTATTTSLSVPIAQNSDPYLLIGVSAYLGSGNSFGSLTVNGIVPTLLARSPDYAGFMAFFIMPKPSGSSVNISLSSPSPNGGFEVTAWSVKGYERVVSVVNPNPVASAPLTANLAIGAGQAGFLQAAGLTNVGVVPQASWSGATERYDGGMFQTGVQSNAGSGADTLTGGAKTVSWNTGNTTNYLLGIVLE